MPRTDQAKTDQALNVDEQPGRPPLVVLVHGSLDRAASFRRVVRRLAGQNVLTYDRRGYARSRAAASDPGCRTGDEPGCRPAQDVPAGPPVRRGSADREVDAFDRHVQDLLALIDGRESVVVGHSYGATIALAAAMAHPPTLKAVGAYEPPLPWEPWWAPARPNMLDLARPELAAETFFRRVAGRRTWDRLPERTKEEIMQDGAALVAETQALRMGGPRLAAEPIAIPVLLLRGEHSPSRLRRSVRELRAIIPGAEMSDLGGAGHGAHLTHPDAFAHFVLQVVKLAR